MWDVVVGFSSSNQSITSQLRGQPRWADSLSWDVLAADPEVLFVFDTQRKSAQLRQMMLQALLEPTRVLRQRLEAAAR